MAESIKAQIYPYLQLMRLHKPIGVVLCLWPSLWALWLATSGHPSAFLVTIFVVGAIVVRAAGCVINDYADRNFDAHVARTAYRPLAQGLISKKRALSLFATLVLIAFLLVLQLNTLTILLSVGCIVMAVIYPFSKRFTHFAQLVLSLPFNWGVILAYSATMNTIPLEAWILFAACCAWTLAYDTMYAMVDRDDDIKIGLKSTAIFFGNYDRLAILGFQALFIAGLIWLGFLLGLGVWYFIGCLSAVAFSLYQQN
ncbi:4-hydroxybenzoate octaprenyltransferase [Piscirickettsia litoralis]|uniref:4-hydroxybenzoate octaprenyltransferase n=1 Tax=Piscirickettsia litoralis TaxID=1891921 RepID=UPI000B0206ED|nr:4-hydroxybenzoate octaprenyltransferase [Piscirickettsia litoralis]